MMNTMTLTAKNNTRTLLKDEDLTQVVGGAIFGKPDRVGDSVFDNRYRLDLNSVYYAQVDNGCGGYCFTKVLLLKVYEENVCNWFWLYQETRTLCVYMDSNGNEHTASIKDIYYVNY